MFRHANLFSCKDQYFSDTATNLVIFHCTHKVFLMCVCDACDTLAGFFKDVECKKGHMDFQVHKSSYDNLGC